MAGEPEVLADNPCPKCKYPRAHKIGETLWLHCNGCGCEYNTAGSIRDTRVGAVLDIASMSMISKDWPEYLQRRSSAVVDDELRQDFAELWQIFDAADHSWKAEIDATKDIELSTDWSSKDSYCIIMPCTVTLKVSGESRVCTITNDGIFDANTNLPIPFEEIESEES